MFVRLHKKYHTPHRKIISREIQLTCRLCRCFCFKWRLHVHLIDVECCFTEHLTNVISLTSDSYMISNIDLVSSEHVRSGILTNRNHNISRTQQYNTTLFILSQSARSQFNTNGQAYSYCTSLTRWHGILFL